MNDPLGTPSPRLGRTLALRATILRIADDAGIPVRVERVDVGAHGRVTVAIGTDADTDADVAATLADLVASDAGLVLEGTPVDYPPLMAPRGWCWIMQP